MPEIDKEMPASSPGRANTQVDWAPKSWFEHQMSGSNPEDAGAYFGHAVSGYQRFRHHALLSALQEITNELATEALLDVGCATGELTELMTREMGFKHALGIDFLDDAVALATRRYPELEFRAGALPAIDAPDDSVDLVIASEVLYYLTPESREQAIAEICRVLRPQGHLLFTTALGDGYFSPESATGLIGKKFEIRVERYLKMSLYHKLIGPFELAGRLLPMLRNEAVPGSDASRKRLEQWRQVLSSPPITGLLKILAALAPLILRNRRLPAVVQSLPIISGPPTNIIIVARGLPDEI